MAQSGEQLLCQLIERVSGVYTGSSQSTNLTLSKVLTGRAGEETSSDENLCWLTQTHWPVKDELGDIPVSFKAQKCIVLVRNPLSVLAALCTKLNLSSSTLRPSIPFHLQCPVYWDTFVRQYARLIKDQFEIVRRSVEKSIPTLYIRFEDLGVLGAPQVMNQVMGFMLGVSQLQATLVESKIESLGEDSFINE